MVDDSTTADGVGLMDFDHENERLVWEEIHNTYSEHGDLEQYIEPENLHVSIRDFDRLHGQMHPNRKEVYGDRVKGHYTIAMAEAVVGESEHKWRDTVRHELAHAFARADTGEPQKHGDVWKEWAERIGADPSRLATTHHTEADYMIGCPNGCSAWRRHRRTKTVQQPWRYHCPHCDANISSVDAGKPIPDEPGHCLVESIDWETRDEYYKCGGEL